MNSSGRVVAELLDQKHAFIDSFPEYTYLFVFWIDIFFI